MKYGSKAIFEYLKEKGLLDASREQINEAKLAYRRAYKREWKKNRQVPSKEIRPVFSLRQYVEIKIKADLFGLNPTKYVKQIVLADISGKPVIPNKGVLLQILQLLGMIAISISKERHLSNNLKEQIAEAEALLLKYVKDE